MLTIIQAQDAEDAANEAAAIACNGLLNSYDASIATISEMQSYVGCVDLIYPAASEALTGGEAVAITVALVVLMAAVVWGFMWGMGESQPNAFERFFGAVLGACMAAAVMLALLCLAAAIAFIFS